MKFKKVKYKVTCEFSLYDEGDILDSYLIADDGFHCLLYHPKGRDNCGCFEICVNEGDFYESLNKDSFVNTEDKPIVMEKFILRDSK